MLTKRRPEGAFFVRIFFMRFFVRDGGRGYLAGAAAAAGC